MQLTPEPLTFTAADGIVVRGRRYPIATAPKAVIAISHGMFEHQGRYLPLARALAGDGYAVYSVDHRNHGLSDGVKGKMTRFDVYVDDFDLLVTRIERDHPGVPIVVVGHSMGGLIAVRFALRAQARLAGLVLSGAALLVGEDLSRLQRSILNRLGRALPFVRMPKLPPGTLDRDPAVEAAFAADPLSYHQAARLGFVRKIYLAAEATRPRAAELRLPLLVMHGGDDHLTSPRGSEALVREASSVDKELRIWPGARHEIFNDLGHEEVIATVLVWLDARFGTTKGHTTPE